MTKLDFNLFYHSLAERHALVERLKEQRRREAERRKQRRHKTEAFLRIAFA